MVTSQPISQVLTKPHMLVPCQALGGVRDREAYQMRGQPSLSLGFVGQRRPAHSLTSSMAGHPLWKSRLPSAWAAGGWGMRPAVQQAWALLSDPSTHTSVEQSCHPSRNVLGIQSLPVRLVLVLTHFESSHPEIGQSIWLFQSPEKCLENLKSGLHSNLDES